MADCKKYSRVPSEYQELTAIANNGTQYIDTGLKGSDLADCELEIVMRNNTTLTTAYNFNGTYLSGSTAQFGLVATSSSECRSSINFGFADAVSTTGLNLSDFHTIYATNGLQKVDNTVVGTLNFGTLNDGNFLLFARTDPNQGSGINVCIGMSLKSFTVKRNNHYIRNMIPVRRKSDNQLGLYDLENNIFYTNQGSGSFTAGSDVDYWQHSLRKLGTSTDTITTLPAELYPNAATATVGLKGNTVQNGTPTPDSPVMPQGTGERTAQLFDGTYTKGFIGTTYIYKNTGTSANCAIIPCEPSTTYTVKKYDESNRFAIGTSNVLPYDEIQLTGVYYLDTATTYTFTTDSSAHFMVVYVSTGTEQAEPRLMVNEGSTALPFEPWGVKIPISSASTTTPVYFGEVQTTRNIYKLVLDGTEDWIAGGGNSRYIISVNNIQNYAICSHFAFGDSLDSNEFDVVPNRLQIRFNNAGYTTLEAWQTYLAQQYAAGTPVTVWYVLATPTTGIVNEPLMKIGTYADEVSGITIPVTAGANTISVDTTVQPSEVTVNYKGWHDASVKEKSRNLFDKSILLNSKGLDIDGSINDNAKRCTTGTPIDVSATNDVTITFDSITATTRIIYCLFNGSTLIRRVTSISSGATIDTSEGNSLYICFYDTTLVDTITSNDLSNIMLNTGSTALPYEPYWK